jgi:sugar/nucleoside kinase (ribokinase family)
LRHRVKILAKFDRTASLLHSHVTVRYVRIAPVNGIDYLIIGHITRDVTPDGNLVGGTVSYAGRVGAALGCQTAVLTSCEPNYEGLQALANLTVEVIPAAHTSTFENIYTESGRTQTVHAIANPIEAAHLPADWTNPAVVHLGPLTNEVDPAIIHQFPNSIIGMTPQGWMRRWTEDGHIYAREWPEAEQYLPLANVVILSEEDLLNDEMLPRYRQAAKLLVLTENVRGCTVFSGDDIRQIPAPNVPEVEPTGAGDIFAAAFLTRYWQNGRNPWQAAEFANIIAAHSVSQVGLDAKIQFIQKAIEEKIT